LGKLNISAGVATIPPPGGHYSITSLGRWAHVWSRT